ncbi:hypothetical protein BC831DRAFT_466586 [Entophlyctis helioformis]|nr:hypothetical protein BC831DRAFT_466586 [Entophlyctis helioformis]
MSTSAMFRARALRCCCGLSKTTSLSLQHSLVSAEVQALRLTMAASPQAKPRDLVRAIFCEMMGFDTADFAHLQAIILCQNAKNLYEKRSPTWPFHLSQWPLESGLASPPPIEVAMALSVVSTYVHRSLSNESELVRRKAVIVFARFHALDPLLVAPYIKALKQTVADPHPSVMSASLDAAPPRAKFKSLALPSPFVQINCMRLLSLDVVMTVLNGLHRVGNMQQGNIATVMVLLHPSLMPHVWHVIASLLKSDVESDLLAGLDCFGEHVATEHDAIQQSGISSPTGSTHHTIRSEAQPFCGQYVKHPPWAGQSSSRHSMFCWTCAMIAALAGSIVPILLDAMQPIQDNAFLQKAYSSANKTLLDAFERTWLAPGSLDTLGMLVDLNRLPFWTRWRFAISTLAGVPGIHGSPNMDMDAELVAHLLKCMSDAVERLRECTHVGVAHRARMYLDSANTLIQA